jgi:hypothetical protein
MWKKLFVFDQPSSRDQHTLTRVGPLFYLCGGQCDGKVLDELWTLNTSTVNWGSKTLELPGAIYERQQGPAPALSGHAAANFND